MTNSRRLSRFFGRLFHGPPRLAAGGFFLCLAGALPAGAQPSGGPYGPVPQRYELPQARRIYYVAPDGKADSPGSSLGQPTTLESAIAQVVTGDAIVLRGGTYRTGGLVAPRAQRAADAALSF